MEFQTGFDFLSRGIWIAHLTVLGAGILTSFTPCIYPMIPIVVGVIGGHEKRSRIHALTLTLSYILGLAVVYTALGVIAAMTGQIFGKLSGNPWLLLVIANIIILLGLSMLDVFQISFIIPGLKGIQEGKRTGYLGTFLIGAASGLIAAPCTAPVLGLLLTYIATTRNAVLGTSLMFTFAIGMNTLILIAGVSAGVLTSLPRSGVWMNKIKKFMGFLMIGIGEYFLIQAGKMWF
jgi:thiol:disulfide interchange protein DsbD